MPDHVLIIDDDVTITQVLSLLLKTHGFNVTVANSGKDGIQLIKTKSPQVVILDLMMPEIDGWEVCRQVRTFSNVPILVLSAVSEPKLMQQARQAGADDYLIKPVPSDLLVARLKALLQKQN